MKVLTTTLAAAILIAGAGCGGAELTAADLPRLDDQERAVFLLCQSDKYVEEHGKQAWETFSLKYDSPSDIEAALLKRGYSCTEQEVHDYF